MKCDKCGAELKSGAKFCTVCGENVEVQRTCPNCGKPVKDGAKFCRECGAAVNTIDNASIKTEQVGYAAPAPIKSSKNKVAIGIIAAVVAVVVLIGMAGAVVLPKPFSSRSSGEPAFYIKGNSVYLTNGGGNPKKLTDGFLDTAGIYRVDVVQDGIYSERYYNNFSGNELINYGDIERIATQGYYNGDNYVSMNQHNDDKDYAFSGMFYTDSENGLALFPQNVGLSLFDCVPTDGSPHWYEIEKITGYDLYYCKTAGRASR